MTSHIRAALDILPDAVQRTFGGVAIEGIVGNHRHVPVDECDERDGEPVLQPDAGPLRGAALRSVTPVSADRLAAMEIFVRVVDAGSFSAAASQLGVGQPAVSKAVAQLEERLGVRLLLRSTRRLTLTDAGKTFYENAKQAIENVNQAELAARGDAGLSGTRGE